MFLQCPYICPSHTRALRVGIGLKATRICSFNAPLCATHLQVPIFYQDVWRSSLWWICVKYCWQSPFGWICVKYCMRVVCERNQVVCERVSSFTHPRRNWGLDKNLGGGIGDPREQKELGTSLRSPVHFGSPVQGLCVRGRSPVSPLCLRTHTHTHTHTHTWTVGD
jgi:hypothetical protein